MKDYSLYRKAYLPDENFPVKIIIHDKKLSGPLFESHWHEQIEILYFTEGKAIVECNSMPFTVVPGDLIIVNSNELHNAASISDYVVFYCIDIDPALIQSSFVDTCELKYITPLKQNLILFKNKIENDPVIIDCINKIFKEYELKETSYELAIKSFIYWLLVLLFRHHIESVLTEKKYKFRSRNFERLNKILKYIKDNYTEKITIDLLAQMSNMSASNLYRMFNQMTGKTLVEYINSIRIDNAEHLLKSSDLSISEIALEVGFNDINYFSRMFKKYTNNTPTAIRKNEL